MQESFFEQPEMDSDGTMVYSVEECHFLVQEAVSRLGKIKVRGELNDARNVRSQMAFFDLKDSGGPLRSEASKDFVLKCAMFGWQFQKFRHLLENGLEVVVVGRLRLYKTGSLSLVAEEILPYGEGAWRKAFEELKKRLAAKGHFDEARKRPLPQIVQSIGLITSEEGKGIQDFLTNLGNYGFRILFYGVWVEGDKAEESIVRAFRWFNTHRPDMDVLVLIRGGGGFENLKVFNAEKIADAIISSRVPVITGIGHEKDESIADYVADKHLSTPTAAAVFLRRQREDVIRLVEMLAEQMEERVEGLFQEERLAVNVHSRGLELATARVLERYRFGVRQMAEKLHRGLGRVFEEFANVRQRLVRLRYLYEQAILSYLSRTERAAVALSSLNPENVLQRGYSVVFTQQKRVLKSSQDVSTGEKVLVRLWKGALGTRVEEKK